MLHSFLFYNWQWTLNYGDNAVISTFSDSQNLKKKKEQTNVWIVFYLFFLKAKRKEVLCIKWIILLFLFMEKHFPTVN